MRFWDSSALLPLIVDEPSSPALYRRYEQDPDVVVWWASAVECVAGLARRERDGALDASQFAASVDRLAEFEIAWREIQPVPRLRAQAARLVRVHPLRAADALQLAAAIAASEANPETLPFVTLDQRLALAAQREGFPIVNAD